MFEERRQSAVAGPATTPEMWAETLPSKRLDLYRRAAFRLDHRWRLIRRYVRPRGHILDAGCGGGEWVAFLNETEFSAEGLDYSPHLINRVRMNYPQHRWESGTVQDLPYPNATFDAVISWGVIEHDERGPGRALTEFRRVLKPGGVAIVTVPVDTPRQRRASRIQFPDVAAGNGRVAFFQYFLTPDELSAFVVSAGLTVIDQGLQRSPALTLLWPKLSARLDLSTRNRLNKIVRAVLWWHSGIMNMTYCVGRNDLRS